MKLYLSLLVIAFGTVSPGVLANNDPYQDAAHLMDIWLAGQKDYEDIPAIMGLVVKDQNIVWRGAFGKANQSSSEPVSENTMSSVCSMSKVFTATAITKLVDEGKIGLDDRIGDILPRFSIKQAFPDAEHITVRTLLTHTSGIPRDTEHAYWSAPEHHFPSEDELYASLAKAQTIHSPGTSVSYSNVGYALLGQIIQQVSASSYKDYVESQLFAPLNMTNSVVELPTDKFGNQHAIGYTAKNRQGERKRAKIYQTHAMQAAAGISTSIMDLAKFAMWQFRLADSDKSEIISPSALNSMYQTHAENDRGANRGFGYEVSADNNGARWVSHGGICPGYVSYLKMDVTNKMAYAIFVNANRIRAASYVNGLIEIMASADQTLVNPHSANKSLKAQTAADLGDYTGFYDLSPWNSEFYVARWGQGLKLLYLPAQSLRYALYDYQHLAGDVFQLVEAGNATDTRIEFIRNASGQVVKVKNEGNYNTKIRR